jgi:hypothetical protein
MQVRRARLFAVIVTLLLRKNVMMATLQMAMAVLRSAEWSHNGHVLVAHRLGE